MMKYLQKLGKALMLPVAALPVAGILMGVGYLLAPAVMGAAGDTTGFAYTAGFLLIKAGGALIDNMAWLFAVGAAVGLADDHDGTAGLAGLVAFLMIQQLLNPAVVGTIRGMDADAQTAWLATTEGIAFSKIAGNSFIGILSAVIGGTCYNKFKDTRLPDWLAFFSGKRCVAIMTASSASSSPSSCSLLGRSSSVLLLLLVRVSPPWVVSALASTPSLTACSSRLVCTTHSTTCSGSTPSAWAT